MIKNCDIVWYVNFITACETSGQVELIDLGIKGIDMK